MQELTAKQKARRKARQKARLEKQKLAREQTEVSIRYIFASPDKKWGYDVSDEEIARKQDKGH